MNIPLSLTLVRIFAIPVVAVLYFLPWEWAHILAASAFALAALTDWLDGYLARQWGQTTELGEFLDPVADKLLVVTTLILIVSEVSSISVTLPALIVVGREIAISALREWMARVGKQVKTSVIWIAKVKTVMQMVALTILLANSPWFHPMLQQLGVVMLGLSALMTVWSMVVYLKIAWPTLR